MSNNNDKVAKGVEVKLSSGKQKMLDEIFEGFREHAKKESPEDALNETQEEWLRIFITTYLPEPGPTVADHNKDNKRASIFELRDLGVMLEVNRQFFHPLGLALETVKHSELGDLVHLHAIRDSRDDPEGMAYSDNVEYWESQREKLARFSAFQTERHATRKAGLGYVVQPVKGKNT